MCRQLLLGAALGFTGSLLFRARRSLADAAGRPASRPAEVPIRAPYEEPVAIRPWHVA
ncbi:hypothetical protein KGQ20_02790 [Catenulispora sp. NF23]|uniref:Alpha/beta hydrolase n=1 Tax=Catenulispora pinistramenti TaxID=2705254 RepID=A0ABS5KM57_9ACTN|nr:hypothetical protein [Catenulispora pinistramenti]MBS2531692.1 hypothetical protein [Catenulispora pinistramenti]MBS2547137.1 hypothetical protein [Catenulispora pinistramenti]